MKNHLIGSHSILSRKRESFKKLSSSDGWESQMLHKSIAPRQSWWTHRPLAHGKTKIYAKRQEINGGWWAYDSARWLMYRERFHVSIHLSCDWISSFSAQARVCWPFQSLSASRLTAHQYTGRASESRMTVFKARIIDKCVCCDRIKMAFQRWNYWSESANPLHVMRHSDGGKSFPKTSRICRRSAIKRR